MSLHKSVSRDFKCDSKHWDDYLLANNPRNILPTANYDVSVYLLCRPTLPDKIY